MKIRMRIVLASLLAVVLLGGLLIGVVGMGQVAAQTQPANQPSASFVTRLATKLGVEQAKLAAAIIQVQRQETEQAPNERIQQAAPQGKVPRDQANTYKPWWLSRPETAIRGFLGSMGHGLGRFMHGK